MSGLNSALDEVKGRISDVSNKIKKRILGANNEHIDFAMDSFYKLNPAQRNGVIAGIISAILLFIMIIFAFYFSRVNSLKVELTDTFRAMDELRVAKAEYAVSAAKFEQLVSNVSKQTDDLKMKPFFEKLSNQQQISIEGLQEQRVEIPANNPLSENLQEVVAEMRLPKISTPKLLNFLVEIEKSNKMLRIQELQIRGRFGTKLYFDADVKVKGYMKK